MDPLIWILASTLLVSAVSLVGVFTLSFNEAFLKRILFVLVSLAAGALLGNALVHLLPEAYEEIGNGAVTGLTVFGGMMFFFVLEKIFRWHHAHGMSHDDECVHDEISTTHARPLGNLVLVADGIHNITDGAIIAAAFFVSPEIGIATTIAIILHEIPQEIGDFGLLIHSGYTRGQALMWNLFSALTAVAGALTVYFIGSSVEGLIPYITALAAGSFLYIAGADLLPELHATTNRKRSLIQLATLVAGAIIVVSLVSLAEEPHRHEGEDEPASEPVALLQ